MKIGSKTKITRELSRQQQNRHNNRVRLALSLIAGTVIFFILVIWQGMITNREKSINVIQVHRDVAAGTKITEDNYSKYFSTISVQVSLIPDGYMTDKKYIVGKFVNKPYKAKDIVTTDGITDSEKEYNSNINRPVEVAFSLSNVESADAGDIREGDYINMYGVSAAKDDKSNETKLVVKKNYTFKHIFIIKAYDASGVEIDSADRNSKALMFKTMVDEKDVDLFLEMLANCEGNIKTVKIVYNSKTNYKSYLSRNNSTAAQSSVSETKHNETSTTNTSSEQLRQGDEQTSTTTSNDSTASESNTKAEPKSDLDQLKNVLNNKPEETSEEQEVKGKEDKPEGKEKQSLSSDKTSSDKNTTEKTKTTTKID